MIRHRHDLIFLFVNKNWQTSNCKTLVISKFQTIAVYLNLRKNLNFVFCESQSNRIPKD